MPLIATRGAASAQGFGEFAQSAPANYIEDVFSTYLYKGVSEPGNSSPYGYLVNNIDLLTKGGMIWTKARTTSASGTNDHVIVDTLRGTGTWPAYSNSPYYLKTNTTAAQALGSDMIQGVTTTGYYLGAGNTGVDAINTLNVNYCSWTFAKQTKFFDIVTWTGTGATGAISHSHSLGSTPGFIVIKAASTNEGAWYAYHRSLGVGQVIILNSTAASSNASSPDAWTVSSTQFSVNTSQLGANTNGTTYVAYLFAHNAGGFGLTGADNVISCGSFTTNASSGVTGEITLGYEPQWVMMKCSGTTSNWIMVDVMRGFSQTNFEELKANTSAAAAPVSGNYIYPTATGFGISNGTLNASQTWIYIAIRRGPMKVPTTGTSVFNTVLQTPSTYSVKINEGFPVDLLINGMRSGTGMPQYVESRLQGVNTTRDDSGSYPYLSTASTNAEVAQTWGLTQGWDNTGFYQRSILGVNIASWAFQRAPNFFDVVCYTGTGSATTFNHNLGAVPELMIVKERDVAGAWRVYSKSISNTDYLVLNSNGAVTTGDMWNSTNPTSTVFSVGTNYSVNRPAGTFVNYLFATCAGVSKVGSYTGNGTTQTINCGFTGGARFVLIKRTDSTGDWYVYDTARGMTVLTDPYLLMNSASAETATLGSVTTVSTGFALNSAVLADINVNGGSYIFLAIA
jgi:hypothetical protein